MRHGGALVGPVVPLGDHPSGPTRKASKGRNQAFDT